MAYGRIDHYNGEGDTYYVRWFGYDGAPVIGHWNHLYDTELVLSPLTLLPDMEAAHEV